MTGRYFPVISTSAIENARKNIIYAILLRKCFFGMRNRFSSLYFCSNGNVPLLHVSFVVANIKNDPGRSNCLCTVSAILNIFA